jgi:hypothetical protein
LASIALNELIEVLEQHPDYFERWWADVSAKQALRVSLRPDERDVPQLQSEAYDGIDGSHVVVDRDADGLVWAIEIA